MLCINNYTQAYIDECRASVHSQLSTYKNLVTAASSAKALNPAIEAFEPVFFNNMVLLLDYLFVHRSRTMEKKDGNPINEVRVLCHSLIDNNGKMSADKTIRLDPSRSVLKHQVGDEIKLNEAAFLRLAEAYFSEIESKYLELEPYDKSGCSLLNIHQKKGGTHENP